MVIFKTTEEFLAWIENIFTSDVGITVHSVIAGGIYSKVTKQGLFASISHPKSNLMIVEIFSKSEREPIIVIGSNLKEDETNLNESWAHKRIAGGRRLYE